jgi:hypothetical protein
MRPKQIMAGQRVGRREGDFGRSKARHPRFARPVLGKDRRTVITAGTDALVPGFRSRDRKPAAKLTAKGNSELIDLEEAVATRSHSCTVASAAT